MICHDFHTKVKTGKLKQENIGKIRPSFLWQNRYQVQKSMCHDSATKTKLAIIGEIRLNFCIKKYESQGREFGNFWDHSRG